MDLHECPPQVKNSLRAFFTWLGMDKNLILLRNLSFFLDLFSFIQLVLAIALPDILPVLLKTWLLTVACGALVGIVIGLFLGRKDTATTLFFTFLSAFVCGLVSGISLVVIIVDKVKN